MSAPSFSIMDVGRRLNAASIEGNRLDKAQTGLDRHSTEYRKSQVRQDVLLDERLALQDLAITLQPTTLPEAAVQIGLLFYSVVSAIDGGEIQEEGGAAQKIEQAIGRIARTVADAAGVDLAQFGETDLLHLMDMRAPAPADVTP
jgi:hypothetical protein